MMGDTVVIAWASFCRYTVLGSDHDICELNSNQGADEAIAGQVGVDGGGLGCRLRRAAERWACLLGSRLRGSGEKMAHMPG